MINIREKYGKSDDYSFYWKCIESKNFDERIICFKQIHKNLKEHGDEKEWRRILTCEMMVDSLELRRLVSTSEIADIPKINSKISDVLSHKWIKNKQFISDITLASRNYGQIQLLFYFFKSFYNTAKNDVNQLYHHHGKANLYIMFIPILISIASQLDPTKSYELKKLIRESTFRLVKRLVNYEKIDFEEERGWLINKLSNVTDEDNLLKIIKKGECVGVEFKSSFVYDLKQKTINKNLKKENIKEMVAFANTEGGTLIFGVDDNGNILGLDNTDFNKYKDNENKPDKLYSEIIDTIKDTTQTASFLIDLLNVEYKKIDNKTILVLKIDSGQFPIWFFNKDENQLEFYVRQGNQKNKLQGKDLLEYYQNRFKD